jgi:UDPglucose 6-dehydrogenase
MNSLNKIGVIGLGKLGSALAVALASHKKTVLGYDKALIDFSTIQEPQVADLYKKFSRRIKITSLKEVVDESEVIFMVLPTPEKVDSTFDTSYIETAFKEMAPWITPTKLIVLVSTVMPGDCERLNKLINCHFCYSPEFVALGEVVQGLVNPDFILIGGGDEYSIDLLEQVYKSLLTNSPPIHKMSFVSAEVTKMSLNTYVTMKISFANLISQLCDKVGGNVHSVINALSSDHRVNPHCLKPGDSFGGPCFPRDVTAFSKVLESNGIDNKLLVSINSINNSNRVFIYKKLLSEIRRRDVKTISLLGLSYKPDSCVMDNSTAVFLAKRLVKEKEKFKVYGFDFMVKDPVANIENISLKECIFKDFIVIVHPDKSFHRYAKSRNAVFDLWSF